VPLVTPAKDAAGTIKYLVGAEKAKEALYALPVDAQGRPEKGASKLSEESDLSWANAFPSPDGSRIALFGDWCAETILYANSGRTEPMFKDTIGACGRFFDWHPDSRHLLMSADENYIDLGLWLVDTDTWEHTALAVPPNGSIQGGAISPDGQKVIYIWDRGFSNPSEVWMVNTDGQENHLLFTVDNSASDLTWSPDGSQVLLFGREVMVMGADGNSLHSLDLQFEPGCSRRETLPVWSPDSRFLAYTASRSELVYTDPWNPDAFQETQVCLMDLGSGKVQPLLPGESSGLMDPTWSPDGAQIAFVSNRSGTSEIWAVDVDGSNLHQLTQAGQAVRFPYWRRP
jgi:Tol biopolymer transport system component